VGYHQTNPFYAATTDGWVLCLLQVMLEGTAMQPGEWHQLLDYHDGESLAIAVSARHWQQNVLFRLVWHVVSPISKSLAMGRCIEPHVPQQHHSPSDLFSYALLSTPPPPAHLHHHYFPKQVLMSVLLLLLFCLTLVRICC
jgi:hypothetical protein